MTLFFSAILASLVLALAALAGPPAQAGMDAPEYIRAAIEDPARSEDKSEDQRRHMADVMAYAGVKPGDVVVELVPGSGYWTRVFSRIVGGQGHVYTIWPQEMMQYSRQSYAQWQELVDTEYKNVSLLKQPAAALQVPVKSDLVFTSQNYHDYHNVVDMAAFNERVFAILKPGGLYVVIDHVAPAGSGAKATDSLHRIDPALVKKEVVAAGFLFDGSSNALRNPNDPHTARVFDESVRGYTDQFIFRFRKPEE